MKYLQIILMLFGVTWALKKLKLYGPFLSMSNEQSFQLCKPLEDFRKFLSTFTRAYSSSLLRAIIARNHLLFFKIFSNFGTFLSKFSNILPLLPFLNTFLPFIWKIARMPVLSRIGPAQFDVLVFLTGLC